VTSDKVVGPWKSLYGKSVEPMKFNTMPEAAEFVAQYSNVESFEIHGMTNYVTQFIAEAFGNDEIPFNRSQVNVTSIDIEVASDAGFPEPSVALHPVISIAVFNNHLGSYVAWGMGDYDKNKSEVADPDDIEYRQFDSEASLLMNFILWWADPTNMPDVITGWNSKLFDMVYLVNRITSVCGDHFAKSYHPLAKYIAVISRCSIKV
jgi:DNA polymerase elongation subunit (family B)